MCQTTEPLGIIEIECGILHEVERNIVLFFLRITQCNAETHDTHAYSPLWIHIRKLYPNEYLRRTESAAIKIHEVTTITSLSIGISTTTERT